jgi:glyoxylase-like metal-dependent hydrolase (beta-lactamase superfamily II)
MRIHAIQTGLVQIKESQIEGRGHGLARQMAPFYDRNWSAWLPTYAWAIEHPDGVILVDTGSAATLKRLPKWHPYFRYAVHFDIEPEQEAGPQLRALGISPRDVRRVVLTHMHIDHDAGLGYFPNSEMLASAGEIARASGLAGRIRGYLPQRWPDWFDPKPLDLAPEPYGPFRRSRKLTARGDVIAVPTPGHTPDHLSVIVEAGDASIFLAGDASYAEHTMLAGRIDGVSASEADATATLQAIREFARLQPTIYLPTHDPESAQRLARRKPSRGPASPHVSSSGGGAPRIARTSDRRSLCD